jgi:osmotically-inducible protein OsmY
MTRPSNRTDSYIQSCVLDELKWSPRIRSTDVGVEVDGGVVTLTGTVDSWTARLAAQEAAHRVVGVLDVANDIVVKPPGSHERTDTEIAQAVRTALEWNVLVPAERIRTTVSHGSVTLEGIVDAWSEREEAEEAVRNLKGVRAVMNLITIAPSSTTPSPQEIRSAIKAALERHAERTTQHMLIDAAGGKVTLSGEVSSWAELKTVEGAVRGIPGARQIDNQLQVYLQWPSPGRMA